MQDHLYTLHKTYTGPGCAQCGKGPEEHPQDTWLVNGEKVGLCSDILPERYNNAKLSA